MRGQMKTSDLAGWLPACSADAHHALLPQALQFPNPAAAHQRGINILFSRVSVWSLSLSLYDYVLMYVQLL